MENQKEYATILSVRALKGMSAIPWNLNFGDNVAKARQLKREWIAVCRKRGQTTIGFKKSEPNVELKKKRPSKKSDKVVMDLIGELDFEDESIALIKWRNFEVKTLVAIKGGMDREFSKKAIK